VGEAMASAGNADQLPYPPRTTEFTAPFWSAVADGRLTTTRCTRCEFLTFPPKVLCPQCWSRDVEYVVLSGRGRLATFTEVCVPPAVFRDEAPYVIGIVDLEENVRLLTRIRAPFDELTVGLPVHMVVRHSQPVALYEFAPSPDTENVCEEKNA